MKALFFGISAAAAEVRGLATASTAGEAKLPEAVEASMLLADVVYLLRESVEKPIRFPDKIRLRSFSIQIDSKLGSYDS